MLFISVVCIDVVNAIWSGVDREFNNLVTFV